MAGLVSAIHVFFLRNKDGDARTRPGRTKESERGFSFGRRCRGESCHRAPVCWAIAEVSSTLTQDALDLLAAVPHPMFM